MNIRVKASKDIKRLTEERNSALHEYSVIMSEREEIHREMEKLQAWISTYLGRCFELLKMYGNQFLLLKENE